MSEPLRYEISDELIRIQFDGDHSVGEFLDLIDKALANPASPQRALLLIDGRRATVEWSTAEVKDLVRAFSPWVSRFQRIAVVTGPEFHYGLVRMAATLLEDSGLLLSPFRDLDEALRFLGLPHASD